MANRQAEQPSTIGAAGQKPAGIRHRLDNTGRFSVSLAGCCTVSHGNIKVAGSYITICSFTP